MRSMDLRMYQGKRFEQPVIISEEGAPKNLTGYTARMQIREWKDSATVLADYTTENGRLLIDGPAGKVTIVVPGSVNAAYGWGDAFYDLEVVDGGGEPGPPILEGKISLVREVTR